MCRRTKNSLDDQDRPKDQHAYRICIAEDWLDNINAPNQYHLYNWPKGRFSCKGINLAAILGAVDHPTDPTIFQRSGSQCHGWGSMHSRVHKLATRSMQQRCIPRTSTSVFSRGVTVHTDIGKHVVNVGVHSFPRIISSSPLFITFLAISLFLLLGRFPFVVSPSLFNSPSNRNREGPFLPLFIPHRGPLSWIPRFRTAVSHLRSREN